MRARDALKGLRARPLGFCDPRGVSRYTSARIPTPGGGSVHPPPAASVTRKCARVGDGIAAMA